MWFPHMRVLHVHTHMCMHMLHAHAHVSCACSDAHVCTLRAPAGCGAEVLRLRGQLPPELAVERVVVGRVELGGDSLRLVHHSLPAGLDRLSTVILRYGGVRRCLAVASRCGNDFVVSSERKSEPRTHVM